MKFVKQTHILHGKGYEKFFGKGITTEDVVMTARDRGPGLVNIERIFEAGTEVDFEIQQFTDMFSGEIYCRFQIEIWFEHERYTAFHRLGMDLAQVADLLKLDMRN